MREMTVAEIAANRAHTRTLVLRALAGHEGPGNAISASDIRTYMINEHHHKVVLADIAYAIKQLREDVCIPVLAGRHGYYLPARRSDIYAYVQRRRDLLAREEGSLESIEELDELVGMEAS